MKDGRPVWTSERLGTFDGAPISGCAGNSRVLASWTSKRNSYHFIRKRCKRGTNKKILLKAKRKLPVISHNLSLNKRIIRVYEIVAREISLLWNRNLSLWRSTSSVQPLQANMEYPRSKKRGRRPWRASPRFVEAVLLQGRTLKDLALRRGLTPQAMGQT